MHPKIRRAGQLNQSKLEIIATTQGYGGRLMLQSYAETDEGRMGFVSSYRLPELHESFGFRFAQESCSDEPSQR